MNEQQIVAQITKRVMKAMPTLVEQGKVAFALDNMMNRANSARERYRTKVTNRMDSFYLPRARKLGEDVDVIRAGIINAGNGLLGNQAIENADSLLRNQGYLRAAEYMDLAARGYNQAAISMKHLIGMQSATGLAFVLMPILADVVTLVAQCNALARVLRRMGSENQ